MTANDGIKGLKNPPVPSEQTPKREAAAAVIIFAPGFGGSVSRFWVTTTTLPNSSSVKQYTFFALAAWLSGIASGIKDHRFESHCGVSF
jgi:hypothetical protein